MEQQTIYQQETICALATAQGVGAIAVIRVSGDRTFAIVDEIFYGKDLSGTKTHTVHFGTIREGDTIIDEVLVTVFRSPHSFTKEDSIEISCHGSDYIIRKIMQLLVRKGARIARPGEFTQRAFLNGQFDLVQAEAVADLIAADSEASHRTALNQLRGGFSKQLASLREELIHFASLVELELDFGEEDVEFAERDDLRKLIQALNAVIMPLIESFDFGNALKEGIPVAIIGSPNVGKSTLLNALLNEEKAIVTSIAGTTRDVIEDTLVLGGVKFRIIDTAGIRETTDIVESMGIDRSKKAMEKADIVLMLFDSEETLEELEGLAADLPENKRVVWVRNKVDLGTSPPAPLLGGEGGKGNSGRFVGEFKSLRSKVPELVLENARLLRQNATDAETYLWSLLRNRQLNGLKFRRQHPLEEGFVLDFFCASCRLAIEVDGGVHNEPDQKQYDAARTDEIKRLYNIDIIRFSNEAVLYNTEQVLQDILQATHPSPVRGGAGGEVKQAPDKILPISAATRQGLETLKSQLVSLAHHQAASDTVVTNMRHYEHLVKTHEALNEVLNGLDTGITGDFLAQDIRLALHHLGEITGTIVTEDLLANIFGKFCIGK